MQVIILAQVDDLISKGRGFLEEGQFETALEFFEQALLLNQNDPEIWNFKGISLRCLGRYTEAIECFNKSLEIDPRDRFAS